ncbi:serine hydrolase domain-containing protein [Legionella cincinnatiensis]|uniref:Beta-lactamase n=1 Tax=Legionella cincinnatiensis TaxID=28085 RepID=A0A378IEQ2_9GAMM|nr:serine hydrolase [Legionella cincinnatiensis]KTC92240.1 putative secreted esterase [Legionella cincinnatiensis]STX33456.1 Beta-lactamase [Legionella cincinnatiensis]
MKEKIIKLADLSSLTSKPQYDVEKIRTKARISQISVATVIGDHPPVTHGYGDKTIDKDTAFGAASLSKPIFTYLVLKLVEEGKLSLDMNGLNNILPFKSFCEKHGFGWKNDEDINEEDISRINAFTPAMILSHKTGFDLNRANQVNHQFEPGQEYYRYSGLPLFYLQKVIEKLHEPQLALMPDNDVFEKNKLYVSINPPNLKYKIVDLIGVEKAGTINLKELGYPLQKLTDIQELNPYRAKILEEVAKRGHIANLEVLAHKYVFDPLHMDNSSFGEKPCAANSLMTTAQDYALFVQAWMNDKKLQYAFNPQISMTQDPWAKEMVSNQSDLKYVAECLGFQLEVDEYGKPLTAFKTGDMGPWRGWVAIDLSDDVKERKATVYFAKGPEPDGNGHILAESLIKPHFQLDHGIKWFKEKYGFATGWEENWEDLQHVRCKRGMHYQEQSPKLPQSEKEIIKPIDSIQKMLQLMPPSPKPTLKINQSQELETNSNQPIEKIEEIRNENKAQEETKFNPTPFSYTPY